MRVCLCRPYPFLLLLDVVLELVVLLTVVTVRRQSFAEVYFIPVLKGEQIEELVESHTLFSKCL